MKFEIGNKTLCSYCFNSVEEDNCKCGNHDNEKIFLPVGYILNGTIIVGSMIKSTGYYTEYYGFESQTGAKVLIKEFNPETIVLRAENGNLMIKAGYEETYNNALKLFINRLQILQKEDNKESIFNVKYAFMQNNTSYFITEYKNEVLLKAQIGFSKTISQKQLLNSLYNCLLLLKSIHNKGFIHSNISDETVYISENGLFIDGFEPSVDELGILLDESLVFEKSIDYLPLSYFCGQKKERTVDLFSLGLVFYTLLTGKKPSQPFSDEPRIDIDALKKCNIDKSLFNVITCMCLAGEKSYYYEDEIILELMPLLKKNHIEVNSNLIDNNKIKDEASYNSKGVIEENNDYNINNKRKTALIIAVVAVMVLLVAVFFVFRNKNDGAHKNISNPETYATTQQQVDKKHHKDKKNKKSSEETKLSEIQSSKKTVNTKTKTSTEQNIVEDTEIGSTKIKIITGKTKDVTSGK